MPNFDQISQKIDLFEAVTSVDVRVYSLSSILKSAYTFLDKAYIFIEKGADPNWVQVLLRSKKQDTAGQILAGEFHNELLNQLLQETVDRETARIRELLVAQAFAEAELVPDESKSESYTTDPNGIRNLQGN